MKKIIFILLALLAIVIILPLSFNNSQIVEINYLLGKFNWPLSVVMLVSFLFGVLNKLDKQRKRDEIAIQFKAEKSS